MKAAAAASASGDLYECKTSNFDRVVWGWCIGGATYRSERPILTGHAEEKKVGWELFFSSTTKWSNRSVIRMCCYWLLLEGRGLLKDVGGKKLKNAIFEPF